MKKIIFFILLIIPINIFASAESFVVMDADSGRVLSSLNMNKPMLIASTTKIMTAIVALENGDLNTVIETGKEVEEVFGSMLYLEVGEKMTLEDLLYGLLLQSGNDSAMVIANNFGYDKFITMMNDKALYLGMVNTTFENPHGLDNETKNYSTSYDLALLMRYAMKNEVFRTITSTKKYYVKTDIKEHNWYNKNKLIFTYKYATGGKIGYTDKSSHVFVSSATKGKENLIIATIKDSDRFNTHKSLYEKNFKNYDKYQILDKYTFSINTKSNKNYHLYIKNDFNMMLKENEKDNLKLNIVLKEKKLKNKEVVGYVEVIIKDKVIHREKIYAISKKNKINKIKSLLFFWK